MAPNCRNIVSGRKDSEEEPVPSSLSADSSIASLVRLEENVFSFLSSLSSVVCSLSTSLFSPITWPTHRGTTIESRLDLLISFKVASNDAHMETQGQDTPMTNGAAEVSTSSPPSPPPASVPAISDISTTAEQGKDGRRFVVASSCFVHPSLYLFTAATTVASGSIAPPKKFSAVKINKRFMEQNSSTTGASQTLTSSPSSKIASTTGVFYSVSSRPILTNGLAKSPPPPATSHPRLVTKLTRLPSSSAGTGPGWTRPSSTTPTLAPSPVSGGVSVVSPPVPAPASHGPPQLPHVGKVIQPQPRGAIQAPMSKPESANGSSKPAWRNVKLGGSTSGVGPPQIEFPTAAEVALGAFV